MAINSLLARFKRPFSVGYLLAVKVRETGWKWPKTASLVLVLNCLFGNLAFSCNSYEECLQKVDSTPNGQMRFKYGGADSFVDLNVTRTLKAIAYKLDEISHKLDKV